MNYLYPVSLNLKNKICIIIGGGKVSLRRTYKLLDCGAMVKVLSPTINSKFKPLIENNLNFSWHKAHYIGPEDLQGASLVFAASNNPSLNQKIQADANSLGILVNIASDGQLSDFIVPSSFNQGDLQVSVSTSGKVPGLSKAIKANLEHGFGPEYTMLINLLEDIRKQALANPDSKTESRHILSDITANYLSILDEIK